MSDQLAGTRLTLWAPILTVGELARMVDNDGYLSE